MISTLRGARSARFAGGAAALTGALMLALGAPSAQAAFTTDACAGADITANGASFQNTAHNSLWSAATTGSFATYCNAVGAAATPVVTYTGGGSGAGISNIKDRDKPQRFVGTDDPISTEDITAINAGKAATGDEGKIHTIPIAVGSVAIMVNVPNAPDAGNVVGAGPACDISGGPLSDGGNVNRERLKLTQAQVEGVFNGSITKWGQLVPAIANPTTGGIPAALPGTWCSNFPVTRVVRFDSSGTTFVQKDFLSTINPGLWNPLKSTNEAINTAWPLSNQLYTFDFNGNNTTGGLPDSTTEVNQLQLRRPPANGGGQVVTTTASIDGGIGYAALSDARGNGGAFVRGTGADDKYWVQVGKPGDAASYTDPATDVDGFTAAATGDPTKRGSNCANAAVTGLPAGTSPTLLSWGATSVANTGDYGICGITYALAFDDYKGVYSSAASYNEALEERKARTVKDYLTSIIGGIDAGGSPFNQGQTRLTQFDYSPLPTTPGGLRDIARTAVASIDWGKTATGGGGGNTGGGGTPGGGAPAGTTTPPPAATPPSNAFTFSKPRASSGNVLLTLQVPGAGAISVKATAKVGGKTITFATGKATRAAGGTAKLTLKPSSAAKKALKKSKRLKVSLSITFTPTGGTAKTSTSSLTVTAPKAKK